MVYINGKAILFSPKINMMSGDTLKLEEQIEELEAENAELIARIEELESGGGEDVFKFPTGEAGFYRHGTNFTELLCTWDEYIANGVTIDGEHYEGGINNVSGGSGWLMFTVPADVIIQEGHRYDLMYIECGNVVSPADVNSVGLVEWGTYKGMAGFVYPDVHGDIKLTTIYIKATIPPKYPNFDDCPNLKNIVVPTGCGDLYRQETNWCDYAELIVEEGTVIGGDNSVVGKSLAAKIIDQDPITEVTATDLQGLTKITAQSFGLGGILSHSANASFDTYYYDIIEKITLPETVTEIESYGISYVPNLKNLTVLAKTPPTLGGSINYAAGGYPYTIYVPAASVDLYKAATNWSNYDIQAIA